MYLKSDEMDLATNAHKCTQINKLRFTGRCLEQLKEASNALKWVHADDSILIVDKPAGLLSVPGRGATKQDCLHARIQKVYSEALVVHRLDMETSGLMVFARNPEIQRRMNTLFEQRLVEKIYVAVVHGYIQNTHGVIDLPLLKDWPNRPKQKVDFENGKPSRTRYKVLAHQEESETTLVELFPETGRSHQLRVHLMSTGHAIVGDTLYAPPEFLKTTKRLLLHATHLSFEHPKTVDRMSFNSEAPF